MKYCCSHDSPFFSWAASLSHSGKETGGAVPLPRAMGDIPGKAAAPEQAREEEEGQKQEVTGAEQASTSLAATPASVTEAGPSCQAKAPERQPGIQPPTSAPPAMPAPRHGATGRIQLQPHWCGHRAPCSDLPRRHKGGTASAASFSLGQRPRAGSEPLPTAGARERLSPPTGTHIWILRFGKSYAVKTDSRSVRGCGFKNSTSPHLFLMFIFNCLCLFLPFTYSPLAYTHCTTLLRFLWMTPTTGIHIAPSSHHISLFQLGSTSHLGDTKSSFAQYAGAVVHCTHDAHPCPISLSKIAQLNVKPAEAQPMLPRERRRA